MASAGWNAGRRRPTWPPSRRARRYGPGAGWATRGGRCGCTRAARRSPTARRRGAGRARRPARAAGRRQLHRGRGGELRVRPAGTWCWTPTSAGCWPGSCRRRANRRGADPGRADRRRASCCPRRADRAAPGRWRRWSWARWSAPPAPACAACPVGGRCAWRAAGYPGWRPAAARPDLRRHRPAVPGALLGVLRSADEPVAADELAEAWPARRAARARAWPRWSPTAWPLGSAVAGHCPELGRCRSCSLTRCPRPLSTRPDADSLPPRPSRCCTARRSPCSASAPGRCAAPSPPLRCRTAIEAGYRLIDTAENYQQRGRRRPGHARVRRRPRRRSSSPRSSTAEWHSVDGVRQAYEASLQRLGVDYLDLLLVHWPNPGQDRYVDACAGWPPARRGSVRAIGTSNFKPAHLQRVLE